MKYDFTTVLDRAGRDSVAADVIPWDVRPDEGVDPIPMWIADMSFPVAPPVLDAMRARLDFPSLGYFPLSDDYFNSILRWQRTRNGVEGLEAKHIGYENGVLGGVYSAMRALSAPGDKILLHEPTYVGFLQTLDDLGRQGVFTALKQDEQGVWRMDYEDMDRKLRENHIHLAIFCSPHNPTGRVWERWEIEKAMEVYAKNDCFVISDEIWSDIILPGYKHTPTQSVSADARQRTVAFYAPSKTFSLAGLVGSYHIIYNAFLRDRIRKEAHNSHYNESNVLSMHALVGAFGPEGEQWAEEMRQVIGENMDITCAFFREKFPEVSFMKPQGTYVFFPDLTDWCAARGLAVKEVQERAVRAGVIWQTGGAFRRPDCVRMNLALPKSRLLEALDRLEKFVFI